MSVERIYEHTTVSAQYGTILQSLNEIRIKEDIRDINLSLSPTAQCERRDILIYEMTNPTSVATLRRISAAGDNSLGRSPTPKSNCEQMSRLRVSVCLRVSVSRSGLLSVNH